MQTTTILSLLGLIGATLAAPQHNRRAVLAHDALSPIAERLQSGTGGELIKANAVALHIAHGCEVYTAVNDAGDIR